MTLKPEHIVEALNKKTFDEIDPDEVLKHYGYKPEEVRCNGVGIGVYFLSLFVVVLPGGAGWMGSGRFSVRPVKVSGGDHARSSAAAV